MKWSRCNVIGASEIETFSVYNFFWKIMFLGGQSSLQDPFSPNLGEYHPSDFKLGPSDIIRLRKRWKTDITIVSGFFYVVKLRPMEDLRLYGGICLANRWELVIHILGYYIMCWAQFSDLYKNMFAVLDLFRWSFNDGSFVNLGIHGTTLCCRSAFSVCFLLECSGEFIIYLTAIIIILTIKVSFK